MVGLRRAGIDPARVDRVKRTIFALFLSRKEGFAPALRRMEREHGDEPLVAEILAAVAAADRGRQGRAAEALGRVR